MLKKFIAFILTLTAIVSILASCAISGDSDVSSSSNNSTLSENSIATSKETSSSETSSETSNEESSDSMTLLINGYFDIILDGIDRLDFGSYENEAGLAEKYPSQTAELVNLGEAAFPVLDDIISESIILTRRAFAEYIKYKIKPELYDLDYPSPDNKYSIKASVHTFLYTGSTAKIYGDINLVDNTENKVIAMSDISDVEINVNWSTDSKYAAVTSGFATQYYFKTDIFDLQNSKLIKLPSYKDIGEFTGTNSKYSDYNGVQFNFSEWLTDNKVKIDIYTIISGLSGGVGKGWYVYDLKTNKIVDDHYVFTEQPSE